MKQLQRNTSHDGGQPAPIPKMIVTDISQAKIRVSDMNKRHLVGQQSQTWPIDESKQSVTITKIEREAFFQHVSNLKQTTP